MTAESKKTFIEAAHLQGHNDKGHSGTWELVASALANDELCRAGWLLCTIGTEEARSFYMYLAYQK